MIPVARSWWFFAPIPAVCIGAAVASASGVPRGAFLPNLLACVLGGLLCLALTRRQGGPRPWVEPWLPPVVLLVIAATLVAPGMEGIHRWVRVGPLWLNASASLLPWLFLGVTSEAPRRRLFAWGLVGAAQVLHLLQPDAAQATALALGALPLLVGAGPASPRGGVVLAVLLGCLAAASWFRFDPLPPVDHVERILTLIAALGALWLVAAVLAVLVLFLPFVLGVRSADRTTSRLALGFVLYFAALFAVTFFGNYPVPVLGAGAGPVLGWWAMVTVLLARAPTPIRP